MARKRKIPTRKPLNIGAPAEAIPPLSAEQYIAPEVVEAMKYARAGGFLEEPYPQPGKTRPTIKGMPLALRPKVKDFIGSWMMGGASGFARAATGDPFAEWNRSWEKTIGEAEKVMGTKFPKEITQASRMIAEGELPSLAAATKLKNFIFDKGSILKGPKFSNMLFVLMVPWLLQSAFKLLGISSEKDDMKKLMLKLQQEQMPTAEEMVRESQIQMLAGNIMGGGAGRGPDLGALMASQTEESPTYVPGEQWTGEGGADEGGASQAALMQMLQSQTGGR